MRKDKLVRCLFTLICLVVALGVSHEARAVNQVRFCATFKNFYWDNLAGQDYMVDSTMPANKHWGILTRNGVTVWGPAYMTQNCTGLVPISSGTYKFSVTSAVQVASGKFVWVYKDHNEAWTWHNYQRSVPQNPTADTTFSAVFQTDEVFSASIVASHIDSTALVANTYKVYAAEECPGGLSCFCPAILAPCIHGDVVYLGEPAQTGSDAFSKSVVGHELGHYAQYKLFGSWNYNYNQNSSQAACKCNHVDDPDDQQHCLQSSEQIGGARNEGWAHEFASTLFNNRFDSDAPFGYYKNFRNADGSVTPPPVPTDALFAYNWLENNCLTAGSAVELDYLGFFYYLDHKTSNSYTFANFKTLFEQECGGTCNTGDVVTWMTLQNAAIAAFPSSKANFLITTGDAFGVNH